MRFSWQLSQLPELPLQSRLKWLRPQTHKKNFARVYGIWQQNEFFIRHEKGMVAGWEESTKKNLKLAFLTSDFSN
jgi:NADPH-dependent ferric siderophore reductase